MPMVESRGQSCSTLALISAALLLVVSCSRGSEVSTTYRGLPNGLGDPVRQRLGTTVTNSFSDARAEVDEKKGTVNVTVKPTEETRTALKSAGFEGLGPCLPDARTYSYYLLRFYDSTGHLLAVSSAADSPVICKDADYILSPFDEESITVIFPANSQVLRDAKHFEFSAWFEPLGNRGRLSTDVDRVPPSWRTRSQEGP